MCVSSHTKRSLKSTVSKTEKSHLLGERKKLISFRVAGSKSLIDMRIVREILEICFAGSKNLTTENSDITKNLKIAKPQNAPKF